MIVDLELDDAIICCLKRGFSYQICQFSNFYSNLLMVKSFSVNSYDAFFVAEHVGVNIFTRELVNRTFRNNWFNYKLVFFDIIIRTHCREHA